METTQRCARCSRILYRGSLAPGSQLSVKCQCNTTTQVRVTDLREAVTTFRQAGRPSDGS